MSGEIELVADPDGRFYLTGKKIVREPMPCEDILADRTSMWYVIRTHWASPGTYLVRPRFHFDALLVDLLKN